VVTITGANFGNTADTVTFNTIGAPVGNWGTTSITATVPPTATTGLVVVMVKGPPSNGVIFTVDTNGAICPAAPEPTLQGGALNQGERFQLPFTMQPGEAVTLTILAVPTSPAGGAGMLFQAFNDASDVIVTTNWVTFGSGTEVTSPEPGCESVGPLQRDPRGGRAPGVPQAHAGRQFDQPLHPHDQEIAASYIYAGSRLLAVVEAPGPALGPHQAPHP